MNGVNGFRHSIEFHGPMRRETMISLKKYLDSERAGSDQTDPESGADGFSELVRAYGSALTAMGNCGADVCPALGQDLKRNLERFEDGLAGRLSAPSIAAMDLKVRDLLQDWGRQTVLHYRQRAREVKDLLLVMAGTAESLGHRDARCSQQIEEVTAQLQGIASFDDVAEIHAAVKKSASELTASVARMTAEGKAVVDHLRVEVSTYQSKLEQAEYLISCDPMTGVGSRLWIEDRIQNRIDTNLTFCTAIFDIDGFQRVNEKHGHWVGDQLLKQFATELRSACRSTDIVGRWGGDEFIVLLDYGLEDAKPQIDRLSSWVSGAYKVPGRINDLDIRVDVLIGMAEHRPAEILQDLLDRVDADMKLHQTARACLRMA